ncbi:MAG TPA: DUF1579 domain-containing protein [Puia sp.]|jgi:hypothetical protein|nr:DUF1579 domain-containing protein [Puia sp.]
MPRLTFSLLALAAISLSQPSHAQSSDDMKAMMAYSTPGDSHKMLAKMAGTWSATVTFWMPGNATPMTSTATAVNEMILGGRYLQSKNSGNMMGQPFEGIGVTGYDNAKKVYLATWIDNFGTGIMTMTGSWDEASKAIVFTGTEVDPASGKDYPIRQVVRNPDDNTQVMEMYATMGGKEIKTMEIKYVRK